MTATKNNEAPNRAAFDFEEFALLFGHDRSWTYRLAKKNKIRVITGFGKSMIPASEVERITSGKAVEP